MWVILVELILLIYAHLVSSSEPLQEILYLFLQKYLIENVAILTRGVDFYLWCLDGFF